MSTIHFRPRRTGKSTANRAMLNLILFGRPVMPSKLRKLNKRRRKIELRRRAIREMMKHGLRYVGQPNTQRTTDDIMDAMNYALRFAFKPAISPILKVEVAT